MAAALSFLQFVLLSFLLLAFESTTARPKPSQARSASSSRARRKNTNHCQNTKQFNFESHLAPTYQLSLSYCKQYRGETCCNRTHTDKIIQTIYPIFEDNFTVECRETTVNIQCSSCDPRIGTQKIQGICPKVCDNWFNACKENYFHFNKRGKLGPCSENNIICSELQSIVSNGEQMCVDAGFEINHQSIDCYDGKPPKFKPVPKSVRDQYYSSFNDDFQNENNILYRFWKAFIQSWQLIYYRFLVLQKWQQILFVCGFGWLICTILLGVFRILRALHSKYFHSTPNEFLISDSDFHTGNESEVNKALLREKRLMFLAKQCETRNQENLEKSMAQILGTGLINADNDDSDRNDNNNNNETNNSDNETKKDD